MALVLIDVERARKMGSTQFRYGHNLDRCTWCDGKIALYLPKREASGGTSLSPAWNSDSQAPGWWESIACCVIPPVCGW